MIFCFKTSPAKSFAKRNLRFLALEVSTNFRQRQMIPRFQPAKDARAPRFHKRIYRSSTLFLLKKGQFSVREEVGVRRTGVERRENRGEEREENRRGYLWNFSAITTFLFCSSSFLFQTSMHFVKTEISRKTPPMSSQCFQYIALHQVTQAFPSIARFCARSASDAWSPPACILSVSATWRCARFRVSEERKSACARKRGLRLSARRGGM
jgi:hypothetical protein